MLLHLCFLISGAAALITLQQPAVVTGRLGHDVLLPCELQGSPDERMENQPVLYWTVGGKPHPRGADGTHAGRMESPSQTSSNKSAVLRRARWSDSTTYECKLSVKTDKRGSFRLKGNITTLVIYDVLKVDVVSRNDSLLRCQVNVSQDPGFALSVSKDGRVLQDSVSAAGRVLDRTLVTLSRTAPLRGEGRYECQLRLSGELLTRSTFYGQQTAAEEEGNNASCSSVLNLERPPEPWFLYGSVLLVPALVLLVLLTATLMHH